MISIVIVSGRSGSGKSTALNVLEDIGYYCIDNLPVTLLSPLIKRLEFEKVIERVAVGIDARNIADDLVMFPEIIDSFNNDEVRTMILYLDAAGPALVKRFSETRRKHPLTNEQRDLREALDQETQLLDPISDRASLSIDTTDMTIHELRDEIRIRVAEETHEFALLFQSFAYKRGVPVDADLVFDVRCLPNPHWEPELKTLTGLHTPVQEFLDEQNDFAEMYQDLSGYLDQWLPKFKVNNRSYLTIAVGCTGGQHRSVYMTQKLFDHYQNRFANVQMRHRELQHRTT